MAENKKSVLLYCDLIHTVNALTDDEAGKLFKHYLAYINDLNPEPPDRLTQIAFEPIKQTLKRDLLKWEEKKGTKSDSGILGNLKRWHPDLYQQVIDNELTIEESQNIAKHRKTSQEVANIAVSVKDKVIVKDIVKDKVSVKVKDKLFNTFIDNYGKRVGIKVAEQKWEKLDESEKQKAINAIPFYIASISDIKYQKHPATYINQQVWLDFEENLKPKKTKLDFTDYQDWLKYCSANNINPQEV